MKKVRFLQDFQGRETNERFFLKDSEIDLDDHMASVLVKEKRAEYVLPVGANPANEHQFEEVPPLYEDFAKEELPVKPLKRGKK